MRKPARRIKLTDQDIPATILRRGSTILVSRRKVASHVVVQTGLVGVPSPAAVGVKCDVGEWIEAVFCQLAMTFQILPAVDGAVPEMEDASLNVADFGAYVGVEAIAPGPIMLDRAIVHHVKIHAVIELPQRGTEDRAITSAAGAGVVQSVALEQSPWSCPRE